MCVIIDTKITQIVTKYNLTRTTILDQANKQSPMFNVDKEIYSMWRGFIYIPLEPLQYGQRIFHPPPPTSEDKSCQ